MYLTPPINRDSNIKQCISVILARDVHIMCCNQLQGSLEWLSNHINGACGTNTKQNYLQMNICKVKWRRVIWINRAHILIMNITTFFVNKSESMAFIGLSNLCGNIFEQFSSLTSCKNTWNFIRLWYSSPNVFLLHNEQNAKTSLSLTLSLTSNWYFMTRDSKCRNMTLKLSGSV